MPLEDLIDLGYQVSRTPEGMVPVIASVWGHDRQWGVSPDFGPTEGEVITLATNHARQYEKLGQALDVFVSNYNNWGSLTAQQKDTANRNAQRAVANLIRQARNDLTSEGT